LLTVKRVKTIIVFLEDNKMLVRSLLEHACIPQKVTIYSLTVSSSISHINRC